MSSPSLLRHALPLGASCLGITTLLLFTGCSEEPAPPPLKQEGEACQVDKDCEAGLACRAEVCTLLNVPADMGDMGDTGGGDMTPSPDMAMPVAGEDYVVSFLRKMNSGSEKGNTYLYTLDTNSEAVSRVSDDANLCKYNCWLSDDATYMVYIVPKAADTATYDVYATSVDASLKAAGSGSVIVPDAQRVVFLGDSVSFTRSSGDAITAFRLKLGTTQEVAFSDLEVRGNDSQDSWTVGKESGKVVVFSPTLQTLSVRVGALSDKVSAADEAYVIDGSNYQMVSGAYFSNNIPAAISPDGKYLAVLTDSPNNYNLCATNADCDVARGQHCGDKKLCTVRELTVHTFDLEAISELPTAANDGKNCTTDADCSTAHECYIPANTQLDKARCIPRRVVLGLDGQLKQPRVGGSSKPGCEITASRDTQRYTDVNAPLSFGPDNNLYLVAQRDCPELAGENNMPDSDILRISPQGGMVDVVTGNMRQDFDDARCYDAQEQKIDTSDCVIYIQQADLSPGGNELAFLGTNPNTTDVSQVDSKLDVWTVLKNGDDREWLGKGTIFEEARRVSTHKKP